jgi:uncharacterized membrane protein YsdA (DUF1294 family)
MAYYLLFGFISLVLTVFFYPYVYSHTDWNPYVVWVAALSATTFIIYGLDKLLSGIGGARTPEKWLHLLAVLGGFPGGWLGMVVFHHKTNLRKHANVWIFLLLATLCHAILAYYWQPWVRWSPQPGLGGCAQHPLCSKHNAPTPLLHAHITS